MITEESVEQAKEWANQALAAIDRFNSPPDPKNYALWYEYHSGRDPELRRAIDAAIATDNRLTEEVSNELYIRFFTAGRVHQAVQEAAKDINTAVTNALASLQSVSDNTAQHSNALHQYTDRLQGHELSPEVADIVSKIAQETAAIESDASAIQAQLKSSTDEISRLRTALNEVQRESTTDPVSGLPNRRFFDLRLPELMTESVAAGEELSVLIVAVDQYDDIIRKWGGAIGDQVLKLVGSVLTENLKGRDLSARFSAEQFVTALPKTRLSNALTVGHIFREQLKRKKLVRKSTGETLGVVTVSVGAAQHRPGEPPNQLIRRVANAHEIAHRRGGNQIVSETAIESVAAVAS